MHSTMIFLFLSSSQFWIQNVKGNRGERNIVFEPHNLQEGHICLLGDGKTGKCVNINNCETLSAEQKINEKICSWNENTPIICCPVASTEFNGECGRRPIDPNLRLKKRQAIFKPKYLKPNFYVAGGKNSEPYSWPWMVSVHLRNFNEHDFFGGCIISEDYVLTAAHCVKLYVSAEFFVLIGGYKRNDGIAYEVIEAIVHPGYSSRQRYNDIALLKLDKQIKFNQIVHAACLPSPNDDYTGRKPTVLGWGDTVYGGKQPEVLQEVTVDIIPNDECNASYSRLDALRSEIPKGITTGLLCAGDRAGGKDSCQYDSGGPLMIQHYSSQRWEVIGVVSFGYQCARPGYPGVYTKVADYLKWIEENTNIIAKK